MIIDNALKFLEAIRFASSVNVEEHIPGAAEFLEGEAASTLANAKMLRFPIDREKKIIFWYGALIGLKIGFRAVQLWSKEKDLRNMELPKLTKETTH